jgi:hypothetical protein
VILSGKILALVGKTPEVESPAQQPTGASAMNIEIAVPEEWTPGQALAMRQLLQQAMQTGQPVIAFVRKDVSPDKLREIYDQINTLIEEAGLQAT